MKAYISCPVMLSQERLNLLPEIETLVKSKGINTFVFGTSGTPEEIFKRDYSQLKSSDLLIVDVSEPSHGVGMEIGMSYCLGLKRILLIEKGKKVSRLAQGTPDTTIIEYENVDDLKNKLSLVLNGL